MNKFIVWFILFASMLIMAAAAVGKFNEYNACIKYQYVFSFCAGI